MATEGAGGSLSYQLEQILKLYPSEHEALARPGGSMSASPLGQAFIAAKELLREDPSFVALGQEEEVDNYKLTTGQPSRWGGWGWLAVHSTRETDTIQYGCYVVFLFHAQAEMMYLALGQGTTYLDRPDYLATKAKNRTVTPNQIVALLDARADRYVKQVPRFAELLEAGWTREGMSLGMPAAGTTSTLGQQYEGAAILYKGYPAANFPTEESLRQDFADLLSGYAQFLHSGVSEVAGPEGAVAEVVENPPASNPLCLSCLGHLAPSN